MLWRLSIPFVAIAVASLAPASASADFILSSIFGSNRFGEDDAIRRTYELANWYYVHEELSFNVFDASKGIVYRLTNSLGTTDSIPFNVETGAFLGGTYSD